jgi:hypothetical protein
VLVQTVLTGGSCGSSLVVVTANDVA